MENRRDLDPRRTRAVRSDAALTAETIGRAFGARARDIEKVRNAARALSCGDPKTRNRRRQGTGRDRIIGVFIFQRFHFSGSDATGDRQTGRATD